jgi:hypothetical protein
VILFLVGRAEQGSVQTGIARDALAELLERLPFFPDEPIHTWASPSGQSVAAWVQHAPERVGDVKYASARENELALFAGRPIRWDDEDPLDPRAYLRPANEWAPLMDGRATALRVGEDGVLEVFSDALGAYPVFTTTGRGADWVSNNPELLHAVNGSDDIAPGVVASLLGGGWSLSGDPVWAQVKRLARGRVHRFGADDGPELLPQSSLLAMVDEPFDPAAAADTLVDTFRRLADWEGRPNVVPVTGGRDSRLVLAAAMKSGVPFTTNTGGEPGQPDVDIGRELASIAGVKHELIADDPHGSLYGTWSKAADLLALTAAGTASLSDALGFPFGPREGDLPLWHSGQGGEVARGYYDDKGDLFDAFTGRRPGRSAPLSEKGERLVREQIDDSLPPDLFYLLKRMGTWAGPSHGAVEYVRDTTSPLWSVRMIPHELAAGEGASERFHFEVLQQLAPELVDVRFEDGAGWAARQGELQRRVRRVRVLGGKVRGELRRRVDKGTRGQEGEGSDPFDRVIPDVRELLRANPTHPAWELLDKAAVDKLVRSNAAALDTMSRYYIWRLATVFTT